VQRDLGAEFVVARERGFCMLIANIASAMAILASSEDPAAQKTLLLTPEGLAPARLAEPNIISAHRAGRL
jgi:hypothetical protein